MRIRKVLPLICLMLICPRIGVAGDTLSGEDVAKIKQVHSKYEEAWLKGDADGVRALFTDDCVLLPPHGDTPRIGQKGLNEYWFPPDGPPTKITKLVVTPQGIGGDGQIAYVWGTHEVAWTTEQKWQHDKRVAQGDIPECARETAEWGVEDVAAHVGSSC